MTRASAVMAPSAPTAVEMAVPWKSQPDFHRTLEISHRARDSHIPTAASCGALKNQEDPTLLTSRHGLDRWAAGKAR
jgi:hypothetical protein